MKPFRLFFLIGSLGLILLTVTVVRAAPMAQTCTGTFIINGLQPTTLSNAASVTLVVTGSGFSEGASVILQNYGGLTTTFVNESILNATIPAGIRPGTYTVTVINGDGTCQTAAESITITGPTATSPPTQPPTATGTAAPTATPQPTNFLRPVINVDSYSASSPIITPGRDFDVAITLVNWGSIPANNIVVSFDSTSFTPRATGGVRTVNSLAPNEKQQFYQPFTANQSLWGTTSATVKMTVSYTDANGTPYSETFNIGFSLTAYSTASPTPTPSATPSLRPKLIITGYQSNNNSIQPGGVFDLSLALQNVGAAPAKGVSVTFNGQTGATAGSEFGNFSPNNASNLQFAGDMQTNGTNSITQPLFVNGAAKGGAYSLKFTVSYTDELGESYTEEQIISVAVNAPPQLEVGFAEEPEPFLVGEPSALSLQLINRGLTAVTLGNMTVTAEGADLSNNILLVGNLDSGNYFSLDATIIPQQPGPLTLTITVDYTDAFNQPQQITKTMQLTIEGDLQPTPAPGAETEDPSQSSDNFWDNLWAALRGFFGVG
jgi:hypothetical protein